MKTTYFQHYAVTGINTVEGPEMVGLNPAQVVILNHIEQITNNFSVDLIYANHSDDVRAGNFTPITQYWGDSENHLSSGERKWRVILWIKEGCPGKFVASKYSKYENNLGILSMIGI